MSYLLEDRVAEWKAEWAAQGVTLSEAAGLIVTCESAEEFSAALNGAT